MVKGNTTGGKNYKKSKHGGLTKKPYPELEKDQMAARVVRNFGNRNLQCYCNDGKVRICHIRGAMRNRVWVNVGDLVIISRRELAKDADDEKADILTKYEPEHLHKLKQEPGINENLFRAIETADARLDDIFDRSGDKNDGGIEFDKSSSEDEEEKEESEEDEEEKATTRTKKKKATKPATAAAATAARQNEINDDDVNIDNI
jgi:translation initiation factor 1A